MTVCLISYGSWVDDTLKDHINLQWVKLPASSFSVATIWNNTKFTSGTNSSDCPVCRHSFTLLDIPTKLLKWSGSAGRIEAFRLIGLGSRLFIFLNTSRIFCFTPFSGLRPKFWCGKNKTNQKKQTNKQTKTKKIGEKSVSGNLTGSMKFKKVSVRNFLLFFYSNNRKIWSLSREFQKIKNWLSYIARATLLISCARLNAHAIN